MNNKKIGDYISMLRKNNNLTQKELADKLGVTDKAISKWERGAGYPDISMLKPLSKVLGITVNELLEGESDEEDKTENAGVEDDKENSVTNVLVYAEKIMKIKEYNKGKIASTILAISLILAIFICVIVNIAVERRMTWSYIVIGSCVLGGSLFIPPLLYKVHGFLISLRFLTILIIPYLALLQFITNRLTTPKPEWLWSMAFPISMTWLLIIWLMVVFYKFKKMKWWLTIAIGALLCIPGQAITNSIAVEYENVLARQTMIDGTIIPSVFICICVAGIFMTIGFMRQKQK